jgi:hypothetical protein
MNTRWVRIGLLLLVATVWGAVLVKAFFRKPPVAENNTPLPQRAIPTEVAHEAPPLNLHWARDPFLNEAAPAQRVVERSTVAPVAARSVAAAPKVEVAMAWPQVVYKGALNASGPSGKRVAMLSVDGRDVILRTGQEQDGIKLVAVGADSVALRLGDNDRVFTRSTTPSSAHQRLRQ